MDKKLKNRLFEQGIVVAVEAGYVLVEAQRSSGCSGCSSKSGCGTSALATLFSGKRQTPIRVKKTIECEVGDLVELMLDESQLLQHSFMAYGLPLIGLFIFAISFSNLASTVFDFSSKQAELAAILGGAVGLYLGWKLTGKLYQPVMPILNRILKDERKEKTVILSNH